MRTRELWQVCEEAPDYEVSNEGRVRKHHNHTIEMAQGRVQDGTKTVSLTVDRMRRVFVLRRLVAQAFCEIPDSDCDTVIHLDADQNNCNAYNLAWRPRWFAWQYTRQFRKYIPDRYNIPVFNVNTGQVHPSVIAAGMVDGAIWTDIYASVLGGREIYPHGHVYIHATEVHNNL